MRYLVLLGLVVGCGRMEMPAPNVFPNSCPFWDKRCERNFDAQTLYYIGQGEAAKQLMCLDQGLQAVIDGCGDTLPTE